MKRESQSGYTNPIPTPIRILHVDDEPADLEITRIFLARKAKEEFKISSVLSAEEALEKLEKEHFDAIIADYRMPGMDGIELLESVRRSENYADMPFILFTGKGNPSIAEESIKRGADRYITKAGNPASQCNELAHAIRALVK